jgi:hypothetical protein
MKKATLFAGILMVLIVEGNSGAVTAPPVVEKGAEEPVKDPKVLEKKTKETELERIADAEVELRRLRLEDSAGWDGANRLSKLGDSATQEDKERAQRKIGGLVFLCEESRFARSGEVDMLKEMTAEEREFCKARLNLINPLMP